MIDNLIQIAEQAGQLILPIYHQPTFQITSKADHSALTEADLASHHFICDALKKLYPDIPILSEESTEEYTYDIRKNWEVFFLVDPLDGTKEFIKRNGEFTINIALIKKDKPIAGVIHAPVREITYYAEENKGAHKIINHKKMKLSAKTNTSNKIIVVASRSHSCPQTEAFLDGLKAQGKEVILKSIGSALKFGLVADGDADIYPRLAPTMEWDTAAGQVIVNEVGKQVTVFGSDEPLRYNKRELVNPGFLVR